LAVWAKNPINGRAKHGHFPLQGADVALNPNESLRDCFRLRCGLRLFLAQLASGAAWDNG